MFLNMEGFNDGSPFLWNCYTIPKVDAIRVSNGIYDEIKIDETLDIENSIEKDVWTLDTAFDAKFQNNLEAGNIGSGLPIQYIRFKRRKVGELNWEVMVDVPFDKNIENYDIIDYLIENAVDIEYCLVPLVQFIEGQGVSSIVTTDYKSLFLTGRDENNILQNYPLRFDEKASDITINMDKTIQKTLSSKYPAILCGESQYLSGSITVKLVSPTTEDNQGRIDMKAEKAYRESFESFISSGHPILIRNHSMYILGTIQEPKKNPAFDEEVAFGIYDYNMTFTEVNNAKDLEVLKSNGLVYTVTTN